MQTTQNNPIKFVLLLAWILAIAACQTAPTEADQTSAGSDAPTAAEEAEPADDFVQIDITGFSFAPGEITIAAGTTVIWRHDSTAPHTVTADEGHFRSDTLNNGDEFSFTFEEPGSYPYYCEFHGAPEGTGMSGVVTVTD